MTSLLTRASPPRTYKPCASAPPPVLAARGFAAARGSGRFSRSLPELAPHHQTLARHQVHDHGLAAQNSDCGFHWADLSPADRFSAMKRLSDASGANVLSLRHRFRSTPRRLACRRFAIALSWSPSST